MAEELERQDMPADDDNVFAGFDMNMIAEASSFLEERQAQEEPVEEEDKPNEDIDSNNDGENVEDPKEEDKTPSSQDNDKDSSRLTPYFKLLVEEGEFSNEDFEKWDGTVEGLSELRYQKNQEQWNKFKEETLHPRVKWLQDNLEEGVPLEELLKIDKQSVTLEAITDEVLEDNIEAQKTVARQYYKETTRFSDDRIEREIKRLEDSGELKDESKSFNGELKTIINEKKAKTLEQARLERENAIKEQEETIKRFKDTLGKVEEIIPGKKINSVMRDKIFNALSVPVDEVDGTPINKIVKARMEDPMGFEMKLAYVFELTNGFKDWSALTSSAKKQAYAAFEEAASQLDKKSTSSKQGFTETESKNFLNDLDAMYRKGLI